MIRSVFLILGLSLVLLSCTGNKTPDQKVSIGDSPISEELRAKAQAVGKIPTSIEINFISGYWHIASAFNVSSLGDFKEYNGTWFDFRENNEFIWGRSGDEVGKGAWGWDEGNEYIYFFGELNTEFFMGEWQAKNNGDVVICIGSTPNNSRSTQFKLVRRHNKIITE